MLINYIRITFRTFFKNKTAFLINLLGMSIALGCCITAFVNYRYNVEFDREQHLAKNIYRIGFYQQTDRGSVPYGVCPMPVGNLIRESIGRDGQVIRYISKGGQFRIGDEMFQKEFVYADPVFTEIFSMKVLSGTLSLSDKGNILVSDKLALTYFGTADAVGKPLTQIISGKPREFMISGVYRAFPTNSSFRFDLITTFDNYFTDPAQQSVQENDWSRWTTTFLYLAEESMINPLREQLKQYISPQNDARPDLKAKSFYVEPFTGMSARAVRERNQGHWMNMSMPPAAVIAPFAMAGFLLLVACFNFMNNAIAVAGNRLKEIGIRKTVGGRRMELVAQFLSETFVFCFLSLALALVLAEYLVAGWNGMWAGLEMSIAYRDNIPLLIALAVLLGFTAVLAGGYPAFYISAFRPIQILRGTARFGRINLLTKSLLVFQFSISLAAVIFAIAFYFNSKYQRDFDLGYDWRSVIQIPLDDPRQFAALKNELAQHRQIRAIGGSQHHIYSASYSAAARAENLIEKNIDVLNIGDNYFETVNIRLVSGRKFEKQSASDMAASIVVNEEFVRALQLGNDPIGKRITLNDSTRVYITGVVKDVYLQALFQPLTPVAFRYTGEDNYRFLLASTSPALLTAVNADIKKTWARLFPNQLYAGRLMEERMVMALEHFDSVVILYTFLGAIAILMSVSGLYSLVSLNLQKRTKELGIRRVLGAPLKHIVIQASKLFLLIMLLSFCIGSILGALLVNRLMDSVWEYYVAVDLRVLVIAIITLFAISISAIGLKIRKVAIANPVNSLKYE